MEKTVKKSLLFIGLTYSATWLTVILFFALGGRWHTPAAIIMAAACMFFPMIMAIVVQRLIYKEPLKDVLGFSFRMNRWFAVAWLLPPFIAVAAIGPSVIMPGVDFTLDAEHSRMFEYFKAKLPQEQIEQLESQVASLPLHPFWLALLPGLLAGITVNAVAGFGEEAGWRGFLQRQWRPMGFWKSSLLIGLVWGIWHAPLVLLGLNYPEHPYVGVFMMIIFCVLLGPIFSYVRLKARSVIAAAIIHGSVNGTWGLSLVLIRGGSDLTVGVTGLAGFAVLVLVNLFLLLYDRLLAKEPITRKVRPALAD